MPYQYVREPFIAYESDRLSNSCETPTERLVVQTLLDTKLASASFATIFEERPLAVAIRS